MSSDPQDPMSELFRMLQAALSERYQLEIQLGSGGMAAVYLGLDLSHHRRVAIKVLHPRLAGAVGHERFLQETRFASELTHPHILPLLDSGTVTVDGRTLPYYTMPFVEGESLRARLQRQKQLPIEEAVSIARDVASALSYAHAHQVVHRDIKPENILLAGTEAVVADFGIARAINRAAERDVITTEGMAVGTPAYMSPEQSLASSEIDGRSDIYALGCVLYEMLGGDPPFMGATPQAIVARHQLDPVPSLITIRPTVPAALELTVRKALQKQPADRFQTAGDLARALEGIATTARMPVARPRRSWQAGAVIGLVLIAGTASLTLLRGGVTGPAGPELDTTLLAVIPGDSASPDPSLLFSDAVAAWSGITLVDPERISRAVLGAAGKDDPARRAAAGLGAGRYVRVTMHPLGAETRVHAVLYETATNRQLADHAERVPAELVGGDSAFARMAERLLVRHERTRRREAQGEGTTVLPARQAFLAGYDALTEWRLDAADSAFDAATAYDPQFSQGFTWLALTRLWRDEPAAQWRSAAERGHMGRAQLAPNDQGIADAVLLAAQGRLDRACQVWSRLARDDPHSFVTWFGLGDCLRRDDAVVRDPQSPTGWRYRNSYHSALQAYRQAFRILPSIHRAHRSFAWLSSAAMVRGGRAVPPDTISFLASPSWIGDSLVFYPVPMDHVHRGRAIMGPTTTFAIRQQRRIFREIAEGWLREYPQSFQALEAVATSMEVTGDPAALDTLHRAMALAREDPDRIRLACRDVFMRLRFGIPGNPAAVAEAARLADSLLRLDPRLVTGHIELASLAALLGRGHLAARLSQSPEARDFWGLPRELAITAPALLVYAALGGPADSLDELETRMTRIIDRDFESEQRPGLRAATLGFAAAMAFASHPMASIQSLEDQGDILITAQAALARGDTLTVSRLLGEIARQREGMGLGEGSLDALYAEAYLLKAIGRAGDAAAWLDPVLGSLATASPGFQEPYRAAALVRAMALRADLAMRLGDRAGARTWASMVAILWAGSDPYLHPVRDAMEKIRTG